ncbi:MAG: hypothetical protein M4D80_42050 [Myxococcota bacterium]|nr:hypothetical protein [Myxococcota bacterium]
MRVHLLLVALAICGCKKKASDKAPPTPSAPTPTSTAELDALWALAPDQAVVGVVISPAGLARLEAGAVEINKLFAVAPELAPLKQQLDEGLQEVFGTTNPSLSAAGWSAQKGLALFATDGEKPILILPVADRDKFLAVAKGTKGSDSDTIKRATCKTIKNVYACSRSPELFDRLGKGNMTEQLKLAGARGDIEVAATIPGDTPMTIGAVAQLSRGAVVVRAAVKGIPAEVKGFLANVKPRSDGDKSAGFAVVNIAPYLATFKSKVPPMPIVPDVTADVVVRALEGPVTMTIENGSAAFDIRIPLNDGAPLQKLVEQCDKIPNTEQFKLGVKDGVCHSTVPEMQLELDTWVDGKTLRIGKKGAQSTNAPAPLSAAANELANGEWVMAMFGRGTMLGEMPMKLPVPPGELEAQAVMGLRAFAMLNELGFGVRVDGDVVRILGIARTAWSNPDDVVAKLVAIDPKDVLNSKAAAQGKAIADASPTSPFAADYKAGVSGLMMPAAMIGVMAAVAIPAYMDYMKKSKRTESSLQLNKLQKNLKVAFMTNAEFPKGKVGPTPAKSCCESQGKCAPDPAAWANPVWQSLDFQIDEPHLYRYAYESADGKSFVAKAIGDLDCDGKEVEYVMTGTVDASGNPSVTIAEPSPGDD